MVISDLLRFGRWTSLTLLARGSQVPGNRRKQLAFAADQSGHVVKRRTAMAELDEQIATYLRAIEVEGKTVATQASYANSLANFRSIGRRLALPDRSADYRVEHVYSFLSELRTRGASAGYQHRRHREVKTCFSWFKRMGFIDENVFSNVKLVKGTQSGQRKPTTTDP